MIMARGGTCYQREDVSVFFRLSAHFLTTRILDLLRGCLIYRIELCGVRAQRVTTWETQICFPASRSTRMPWRERRNSFKKVSWRSDCMLCGACTVAPFVRSQGGASGDCLYGRWESTGACLLR